MPPPSPCGEFVWEHCNISAQTGFGFDAIAYDGKAGSGLFCAAAPGFLCLRHMKSSSGFCQGDNITEGSQKSSILKSIIQKCKGDCFWCGPCRTLSPVVDEIANERTDIKVGKINVDEQPELASQFNIMSIPTLVVMKRGKIANQIIGARPKAQILAML